MEVFANYEVAAGIFLAIYFFVRGFLSLKSKNEPSTNGTTLNSLARDHVDQKLAAQYEAMVSRQEFHEHKKTLDEIREKIEMWDHTIHAGGFSCNWGSREVPSIIDRIERIEKFLERLT